MGISLLLFFLSFLFRIWVKAVARRHHPFPDPVRRALPRCRRWKGGRSPVGCFPVRPMFRPSTPKVCPASLSLRGGKKRSSLVEGGGWGMCRWRKNVLRDWGNSGKQISSFFPSVDVKRRTLLLFAPKLPIWSVTGHRPESTSRMHLIYS
ncbi:hypothetical protein LZ32DRAFT_110654 [Colletotrichum eremochloae]|nr:hypothetical protein LZ32DRAFT_110654 [Colletotrichum eremochloae]